MTAPKPRPRPAVTAAFAVSWDGRLLERRSPGGRVDAELGDDLPPGSGTSLPSLRKALERLGSQGVRRVAFAGSPALFRKLLAGGLLDELTVAWSPRIVGGPSVPPITGMGGGFLPRGIALELRKLERRADEWVARYGVHVGASYE
jgi:riboflavin biosynthesis pyrimidine reductase